MRFNILSKVLDTPVTVHAMNFVLELINYVTSLWKGHGLVATNKHFKFLENPESFICWHAW